MLDSPVPALKAPRRSKAEPKTVQRIHLFNGRVLSELRPRRGERIGTFHRRATAAGSCAGMRTIVAERINGDLVPILKKDYHRKIGVRIDLVLVSAPGGGRGGGGSAGAAGIVGLLALVAFAPVAAGAIAGAAFGGSGASVISALIIGGGSILLSHFMGAKKGAKSQIPEYSVNIRSNESRSQQPIPVPYGTQKTFPDLAASQWSDFEGEDQVFHGIYSLGCGYFDVHEIGIGDTAVWTSSGGIAAGYTDSLKLQFVDPNQDCTLFPVDIYVSPSVSGQQLPDPYGTTYSDGEQNTGAGGQTSGLQVIGPFTSNPSGSRTNYLGFDFVAPGGMYYTNSKGNTKAVYVGVRMELQPIDDQGHVLGDWFIAQDQSIVREQKQAVRISFGCPVNSGRYNVRVSRINAQRQDGGVDEMTWVGLRSYLIGPNAVPYASRLALQLKADRLLSLASQSQIYVIATRKIPTYPNGSLQFQATQNPIWAALDVYNNADYGGNLSLNDVDILTLQTLAAGADLRGETFNYTFTSQISIYEAISTCLRVMMTSPTFFFNKFSAVRDQVRDIPKMLFTDAQIVQGSIEITYTLKDVNTSDGVILEYTDDQTWAMQEVTSRQQGVVLLQPTRIQIPGVTNREQATVLARKMAADNEYRRTTLAFEVEAEGMSLERGDLICVQSELPMSWGALRYLESINLTQVVLEVNTDLDWSQPGVNYVRIRRADGSIFGPIVCVRGSADHEIVLSQQSRAAAEQTQGTLAQAVSRTDTQGQVTLQFSTGTLQGFNGLVTTIEAGSDEGLFKITCVNDAPEVYTIDGQAVEPLPTPNSIVLPSAPTNQLSHVSARLYQDGTSISLDARWDPDPGSVRYQAKLSYDGGQSYPFNVYEGQFASFTQTSLSPNDCKLIIRGVNAAGLVGGWTEIDLVSPLLILNPASLGYGIGFDDLLPSLYANTTFQPTEALETLFDANLQSLAAAKLQNISIVQEVAGAKASVDELTYALATATDAIAGRVLTINASLNDNAASIRQEAQARANSDTATATTITALTATVGSNTAAIVQEAQVRANADSATATVITTLNVSVQGNTAAITQEAQVRANADSAMATTISNLNAAVGSNSAAITNEQQVRANQDSAIAASVTSLSTTVGGNSASISTLQSSVNGVLVQYGVVGTIDGQTGGFIFQGVRRIDGSVSFTTYFKGDLIVDGSIQARNIANGAISAFGATQGAINVSRNENGVSYTTLSVTISVDQPAQVLIDFRVQCFNTGATGSGLVIGILTVDGNQVFNDNIFQAAKANITIMASCEQIVSVGAGQHTFSATINAVVSSDSGGAKNGYLTVTAFKR